MSKLFVFEFVFHYLKDYFVWIDTEEEAIENLNRRRRILPAIYNHNLQKYNWNPPEPNEATCNATVHVKLESEVERLQNEMNRLRQQMGIDDLDPNQLEEIQIALLDDDDDDDFSWVIPAPQIKQENISEESQTDNSIANDSGDFNTDFFDLPSNSSSDSFANTNRELLQQQNDQTENSIANDSRDFNTAVFDSPSNSNADSPANTNRESQQQKDQTENGTANDSGDSNTTVSDLPMNSNGGSANKNRESLQQQNDQTDGGIENESPSNSNYDSHSIASANTNGMSSVSVPLVPVNSIFDPVAGYINVVTDVSFLKIHMLFVIIMICKNTFQAKFDRYFPSADVTISNAFYSLLEFYNNKEKTEANGVLYDVKFVHLLLKSIFGYAGMSEMVPDFDDPKMILIKGKIHQNIKYANMF